MWHHGREVKIAAIPAYSVAGSAAMKLRTKLRLD
jgi:hypothetical protein